MASKLDGLSDQGWQDRTRQAGYQAQALAASSGLTLRRLEQFFRWRFGASPQTWLNALRLQDARTLLQAGHSNKEVALQLGYQDDSSFSHAFRKKFGCSPQHFARSAGSRPEISSLNNSGCEISHSNNIISPLNNSTILYVAGSLPEGQLMRSPNPIVLILHGPLATATPQPHL